MTHMQQEHGVECFMPANGETATIPTPTVIQATVDSGILKEEADLYHQRQLDVRQLKCSPRPGTDPYCMRSGRAGHWRTD